ncbi:MAG: transcription-repair coupling factor, partial [Rhodothalassiaceae bacterium]
EGFDALVLADLARAAAAAGGRAVLHVAREDARLAELVEQIAFFAPDLEVLTFPAWDCLPYDRVSPHAEIVARRMATLDALAGAAEGRPRLVLSTVNAALQRVPARAFLRSRNLTAEVGERCDVEALLAFLESAGYTRSSQVTEPGEFARRGGLIDIYPPGAGQPCRLDFFGDTLERIRHFDPLTQRSGESVQRLRLLPVAEFTIDADSIRRFRQGYTACFGAVTDDDPLYEAVSAGRRHQGSEHWLPLFHDSMETLFSYLPDAVLTLDHQARDAATARLMTIGDYYEARRAAVGADGPDSGRTAAYKPLSPERLYLTEEEWETLLTESAARTFSPFELPAGEGGLSLGARRGRDFAPERQDPAINLYDAVREHATALTSRGTRVILAAYSEGARQRLASVLADHGLANAHVVAGWAETQALARDTVALAVLPLEHGFVAPGLAVITEEDILGDRLIRRGRRQRRADDFLRDVTALTAGDLVVHVDHGIGRFEGLETITVAGAAHDCVALTYRGGDRLYVPVENIELLSRYGSDAAAAELDRLGSGAWQARKARMKARIREMADELIRIAAARAMRRAATFTAPAGLMDEFAARFPFPETEDQLRAIDAVLSDLASGRPMDRLVCGDVGFGKTEVALRAAFATVMAGNQVAVVTPTTLLARQHEQTFRERFHGLPVRIAVLSRLVSAKDAKAVRAGLADGSIDIVIGTHALLGKGIAFRRLGLLVVDEEQHFGVAHKERLKRLKADVHVLTLTATPIPRTLQLAMSGLRDLSLIATPPVDRLAVRTFVAPFDHLVIREALLREHFRGGQSFYVVPRIADIAGAETFLREHVPEVRFVTAHGQMSAAAIEDRMSAFYDGRYEVLLSTTIIESGLDIPRANTLVVEHADRFGLAQLYQLRGRVGRSKIRAYAYLTYPAGRPLGEAATKRLTVLQSLDTLGAGFTLASHDMDIRGAGNLLGEEQSGHIREVGVELY